MRAFSGVREFGRLRRPLFIALALAVSLVGCASAPTQKGLRRAPPVDSGRVVRDTSSVEYDVLVAEVAARRGDFELSRGAFERALAKDPDSAHLHYRLSGLLAQSDELPVATTFAERGMQLDPDDVEGRLFLGRLYRLQRDLPGVKRALLDSAGDPINSEAALRLYQVYLEVGQLQQALQVAVELWEDNPGDLGAAMAVATAYERLGLLQAAEDTLLAALEQNPDRFVVYARLARMRRVRGDREGEIELYNQVLSEHPNHYGTLVSLGEAQIAENDIEGAIETHTRILELFPDDPEMTRRLASLEFGTGRYEEASERLRVAAARYPEHAEFAYTLGQVQRAMNDDQAALGAFELVNVSHPLYVEARMQIAFLHQEAGRPELALEEIEALRQLRPDRGLDFHAAALRARTGDMEGGVALLEEMLAESPDDDEVLYQLGVLYGTHQDSERALYYMEKAIEQNPQNAQALNYTGYSWAERGERLDEAEELIRRAVRLSPQDGYILDSLGWVFYMQAQPLLGGRDRAKGLALLEEAIEQLDLAVELTGGDPVVSEHLGDAYLQLGQPERALEYYQEAVRLEPRDFEQPDLLEKLEHLQRQIRTDGTQPPGSDSQ